MAVEVVRKDLFEVEADVLVNPVNCVGVMGAGVARQFRERYPRMYMAYRIACKKGQVRIGKPMIWIEGNRLILNLPTKEHWREPSQYRFIEKGLEWIRENIDTMESVLGRKIKVIAMPWIGCGLGGLKKDRVYELIKEYLEGLECRVMICEIRR